MLLKDLPWSDAPPRDRRARSLTAGLLRTLSVALDRLARRLVHVEDVTITDPMFEYHAEAGAPEGALFVNGCLVGHLLGVNRL